jgi:hypothetical protein
MGASASAGTCASTPPPPSKHTQQHACRLQSAAAPVTHPEHQLLLLAARRRRALRQQLHQVCSRGVAERDGLRGRRRGRCSRRRACVCVHRCGCCASERMRCGAVPSAARHKPPTLVWQTHLRLTQHTPAAAAAACCMACALHAAGAAAAAVLLLRLARGRASGSWRALAWLRLWKQSAAVVVCECRCVWGAEGSAAHGRVSTRIRVATALRSWA